MTQVLQIDWHVRIGTFYLLLSAGCTQPPTPPAPPLATVKVASVRLEEVAPEVLLLGTVLPVTSSQVAAAAAGKVMEYPFREGALVREGDVLTRLRDVTLAIRLEGARAMLREKKARLVQLQAGYREEEKRQAEAAMLAAEAEQEYELAKLNRLRTLRQKNRAAVTVDQLEEAVSAERRALHRHAEALAAFDLKSAGYRTEEVAQANAAYEAQVQEVLRLEDDLKKRTVTAPFAGYLIKQHSDVGQWVEEGGVVATLVDLSEIDVVVNVDESLMHFVHLGRPVKIRVDALGGELFTGTICYVVPKSDWQGGSRSFPIKIRVANVLDDTGMPRLKEGMLARVVIQGKKRATILAHKDAIVRSSGQPVVYRINEDRRVQPIPVAEGISVGDAIEVTGSVQPGDVLVIEGNERLRPAQEVRIVAEDATTGLGQDGMPPAAKLPAKTASKP